MGETLRRLSGKAAAYQLRETTSAHLRPFQWGVNTSRGCATIAHTARDYLRRHPDHVLYCCRSWTSPMRSTANRAGHS